MPYMFEGHPTTLVAIAQEFPAYGEGAIRAGLQAGHTTRAALLQYLAQREMRARARPHRFATSIAPRLYSRRTGG